MQGAREVESVDISYQVRELMLQKIRERYTPREIWVVDTVYCGRKKVFSIQGLQQVFDDLALNRMWLGLIVGEALRGLGVAAEVPVEYRGMKGRIDVLLPTGEPLEIKTVSSISRIHHSRSDQHIEQLSRYCLAMGKETGVLFYYVPNVKLTSMPAKRYWFNLDEVKEVTDRRIEMLNEAIAQDNPFLLPPTWHSPDSNFNNWECRSCSFLELCRGMRRIVV